MIIGPLVWFPGIYCIIKAGTTYLQNQNHLVANVLLLTCWRYPQGERSVFLDCACKKNLCYFLLSGTLFNTKFKVFHQLIPALGWEFGNCTFLRKIKQVISADQYVPLQFYFLF